MRNVILVRKYYQFTDHSAIEGLIALYLHSQKVILPSMQSQNAVLAKLMN